MLTSFRIAVLISGGGTTLRNFIEKIAAGQLPVEIALVVSSSPTARGLQFADEPAFQSVVDRAQGVCRSQDDFSRAIFDHCRQLRADLVAMGGFLKRVTIPDGFRQPRGQYPSRAGAGVLRRGILRPPRARGRAGIRGETERLHGPFRRQPVRPRPGDRAAGRAGAGRRHARHAGRPGVRGRVRGLSRGVAVDRRRPGVGRRPPRADPSGVAIRYARSRSSNSSSATSIATAL